MKTKGKVVQMSAEERTLIANIKSMVDELEGIETSEGEEDQSMKAIEGMAATAPNEEEEAPLNPEEESDDAMEGKPKMAAAKGAKVGKASAAQGTSEGSTASDDAEERIEIDEPERDQKAIAAVAKALAAIAARKNVKKSADDSTNMVMKALKAIADEVSVQKGAIEAMLQQLGLADRVVAAAEVEERGVAKSGGRKPVGSADAEDVALMVAKALVAAGAVNKEPSAIPQGNALAEVRKDLSTVIGHLFRS